uniref:Uncharacterized protein n=1 Tax=Zea mays TaxID=4577 RepID=A0A804N4G0_MAIZE
MPSPSASRRPLGSSGRFEEALARIEELQERDTGADDSSTASSFLSDGEAASRPAGEQQSHSADFLSDGEAASGGIQRPSKTNSVVRDLRQLVGSLGLGAREPEREGWEHVISKSSDDVSYKAWCDKPTVVANCVHALQQIWALEAANLVAERLRHCIANHWIKEFSEWPQCMFLNFNMQMESLFWQQLKFFSIPMTVVHQQQEKKEDKSDKTEDEKN